MNTRNALWQIGGAAILFGGLALTPLAAGATVVKQNPLKPTAGTQVTSRSQSSFNGETLVGRVGYIHVDNRGKVRLQTASNGHGRDLVLVPKVGYVNVNMAS